MAGPRPLEGGLRRGEIFGYALLQPARSVCVSLSVFSLLVLAGLPTVMRLRLVHSAKLMNNQVALTTRPVVSGPRLDFKLRTLISMAPNFLLVMCICALWYCDAILLPLYPSAKAIISQYHRCASGCVVECRICNWEVAGSNLGLGYFAPRSTQSSIPPGSVNEYQL